MIFSRNAGPGLVPQQSQKLLTSLSIMTSRPTWFLALLLILMGLPLSCSRQTSDPEWLDTNKIRPQPSRHSRLSGEQITRVKQVQSALSEVDPSSIDKWTEDFEKDRDPEKELRLWEAIANAFQAYCSTHPIGIEGKQDVLQILIARSGSSDETQVIRHVRLSTLTPQEARDVMGYFRGEAIPIEVERK